MSVIIDDRHAKDLYNSKILVRRDGSLKITNYRKNITKMKDGIESVELKKNSSLGRIAAKVNTTEDDRLKSVRKDSLCRSRNLLIDYACQNYDSWKSFITLTFKEEVKDISEANKQFNTWRTAVARKCKAHGIDFQYLGVPEFQKNGRVHYHLLTSIPCDSAVIPKMPLKRLYNGEIHKWTELYYYDIFGWSYGFSSCFSIEKDVDDKFNCALYITKYLFKDFDRRLYGHTRVLKSNDLDKPDEYYLMQTDPHYQDAWNFIKEKGYEMKALYISVDTDNPYSIPFESFDFSTSDLQEHCNTFKLIMKDMEF